MNPLKSAKFDKAIVEIKSLDDKYLLAVDAMTTLNYLDFETLSVKNQLKANIKQERYINSVVCISSNAEFLALIGTGSRESKLYNANTKKLIGSVSRHQGDVSCVAIDPKCRYMFSCGDDGITFGVDIKSGQLAFTLQRHIDSINDIAFSQNGELVGVASYDKNISIFNLTNMVTICTLRAHSAAVMKLQFLNNNQLFSVDKNSSGIVWDIATSKVITRVQDIHDDVTKTAIGHDGSFLFLGSKLGYIMVYDLKTYKQISGKYIKLNSAITALYFNEIDKHLSVGTENGEILVYDIFEGEKSMHQAIATEKYSLIQGYIENNPILLYSKVYSSFELLWKETLLKAKELIENDDKKSAIKLFDYFVDIPSKKQAVQKFFAGYADYDKFLLLVKQNRLALAYAFANSNPLYKDTKVYAALESEWKKTIILAQKYLLNPNNDYKVKELFVPYKGVAEKAVVINDLLKDSMIYNRFKLSLANKNFKIAFELIKQHPFLKELNEYDSLIRYSDSIYIKAQVFQNSGDTHSALKLYYMLLDFEDFRDEAEVFIKEIEYKHKFFSAVNGDDMVMAYNLLDLSTALEMSVEGRKLILMWENDYNIASEYASKSDADGIKNTLAKYLNIKSKYMAIATLMSWCHIDQLNISLKTKVEQKIIENGIKKYILYYGLTDQIATYFNVFSKEYPETKLNLESQVQGSMEAWRPSMIIKSILE